MQPREPSRKEMKMVDAISRLLHEAVQGELFVDDEEEMFVDDTVSCDEWDPTEDDNKGERLLNNRFISQSQAQAMLDYYRETEKGYRSLSSMNKRYPGYIRTAYDLQKLREFERNGIAIANRRAKFKLLTDLLEKEVYAKFEQGISLHDADLRMMALRLNRDNSIVEDFKASSAWIQGFKRSCSISSRRITTFVTKKNFRNQQLEVEAQNFVDLVKADMVSMPLSCFFNADQSGFVKESHSARSLAPIGSKKVERIIQSSSATSHSYTVLPMLFADGTLGEKIYVVLQEANGVFPRSGHIDAHNVVVSAGRSHIMTKQHMAEFFEKCVFTPTAPTQLYMVLDSWPAWKDHQFIKQLAPPGTDVTIRNIPAGCTGMIQPEDRYFFRLFKGIDRRITSHVQAENEDFVLHHRDNILRKVSVIFHQFKSPLFRDCWLYAWHVAGYGPRPPPFITPSDALFGDVNGTCSENGCNKLAFAKCARCFQYRCFKDFIVNPHIC